MRGKLKVFFFLLLGALAACEKHDEDRLQEQELIQLIDQKKYHELLKWFERQNDPRLADKFKIYRAYAHMGMGNLEPLEFVAKVKAVQTFDDKMLETFFGACPNVALGNDFKDADRCLTVRLFNQAPVAENLHLRKAREVFREMREEGRLSQQDHILMGFLETSFVLARVKDVLIAYAKLDPESVSYEQAKALFDQVYLAGKDMEMFVGTLKQHKSLLTEKLTGLRGLTLFSETVEGKLEFVENTGLPLFLKVTSISDESGMAMIGRNVIIQVLDQGLEFFSR